MLYSHCVHIAMCITSRNVHSAHKRAVCILERALYIWKRGLHTAEQKSKSKELFHATCTVRTKEFLLTCTGLFLEFIRLVQLYIWLFPIHAALSAIYRALSTTYRALSNLNRTLSRVYQALSATYVALSNTCSSFRNIQGSF